MGKGLFLKSIVAMMSIIATLACADAAQKTKSTPTTNSQIKKAIIKESIEQYPSNCPCPYNTARNGSRCGGRSAYSRAGGYAPICYERDVTQDMIKEWRENHSNR